MSDGALSQDDIDALLSGVDISAGKKDTKSSGTQSSVPDTYSGPSKTQVLSQDEINTLLAAINSPKPADSNAPNYDVRPDLFTREQIKAVYVIQQKFALMAMKYFTDQLRSKIHLSVASVDQLFMDEFNRCIPNPSVLGVVSMEPLKGNIVIEIDPSITSAFLNTIGGGKGGYHKQWYELSEKEKKIIIIIFNCMLKAFKEAWAEIINMNPQLVKIEPDPEFIRNIPKTEWVLLITMEAKVWGAEGMINICVPHTVIKPILDKIAAY